MTRHSWRRHRSSRVALDKEEDDAQGGEEWLFDCVMTAKVRPMLILSIPFGERDRAIVLAVFHSTALRGSPFLAGQ